MSAVIASVAMAFAVVKSIDPIEARASAPTSGWTSAQIARNPEMRYDYYYGPAMGTKSYNAVDKTFTIIPIGTSTYCGIYSSNPFSGVVSGHKYQFEIMLKATFVEASLSLHLTNYSPSYGNFIVSNPISLTSGSTAQLYAQVTSGQTVGSTGFTIGCSCYNNSVNLSTSDSFVYSYLFYFDVTAIYGAGNEPTASNFHTQFQGYMSGYSDGWADGEKTYVSTSISTWNQQKAQLTPSSGHSYFNAKYTGSYNNTANNIYWSSSAYSQTSGIVTTSPNYDVAGHYFQLAQFTKYLNTSSVTMTYGNEITLATAAGTANVSIDWFVYFTAQNMDTYSDISTWNTTSPIWPSSALLAKSELLSSGTTIVTAGESTTPHVLSFSGIREQITDTSFCFFVLASFSTSTSLFDNALNAIYWTPTTTTALFTMTTPLTINYEVIDIPGLLYNILTAPFTFISQGFNFTLFGGTPYAINVGSLMIGIIGFMILVFIVKMIFRLLK